MAATMHSASRKDLNVTYTDTGRHIND